MDRTAMTSSRSHDLARAALDRLGELSEPTHGELDPMRTRLADGVASLGAAQLLKLVTDIALALCDRLQLEIDDMRRQLADDYDVRRLRGQLQSASGHLADRRARLTPGGGTTPHDLYFRKGKEHPAYKVTLASGIKNEVRHYRDDRWQLASLLSTALEALTALHVDLTPYVENNPQPEPSRRPSIDQQTANQAINAFEAPLRGLVEAGNDGLIDADQELFVTTTLQQIHLNAPN